jgi:ATPase subunit of ABC transporter with duplicated ATPase domains
VGLSLKGIFAFFKDEREPTDEEYHEAMTMANVPRHLIDLYAAPETIFRMKDPSAGELFRVCLATELYRLGIRAGASPLSGYLFLDEPAANLDTETDGPLVQTLVALNARGLNIVAVNHQDPLLQDVAHPILEIKDKKLKITWHKPKSAKPAPRMKKRPDEAQLILPSMEKTNESPKAGLHLIKTLASSG